MHLQIHEKCILSYGGVLWIVHVLNNHYWKAIGITFNWQAGAQSTSLLVRNVTASTESIRVTFIAASVCEYLAIFRHGLQIPCTDCRE